MEKPVNSSVFRGICKWTTGKMHPIHDYLMGELLRIKSSQKLNVGGYKKYCSLRLFKKSLEIIVSKTFILKLVGFAERLTIVSIKYLKF